MMAAQSVAVVFQFATVRGGLGWVRRGEVERVQSVRIQNGKNKIMGKNTE